MNSPITIMLLLKRVDCNDGVAAYVESLITGLREIGDRVVVVSGRVSTFFGSEARRRSIEAVALDWIVVDGIDNAWSSARNLRLILSLVRRFRVDVLSPQGFQLLPLSSLSGRLSRTPVVVNFHLLQAALSTRQRIAYRLVSAIFGADRYLAMSREIALFFRDQCGIAERRIHEQALGVDTAFFRPPTENERSKARVRLAIAETSFVGVLPGRMNRSKGHDLAATAFRLLRMRRPDLTTTCLFPGAGDERDTIEGEILRDEADQATFRFLGFVDRLTMRDAYWAADIVLLPSRMEGFPLVVCEAMCCGAIVIRTPSSGWQEQVIEGRTGFVVPFDDPIAIAGAIERIADSFDRFGMREYAMRLASSKFSRSRMVTGTSDLYREVADASRPRERIPTSSPSRSGVAVRAMTLADAGAPTTKVGKIRSCD